MLKNTLRKNGICVDQCDCNYDTISAVVADCCCWNDRTKRNCSRRSRLTTTILTAKEVMLTAPSLHGIDTGRRRNTIAINADLRAALRTRYVVQAWTDIRRNAQEDTWDLTMKEDFSDLSQPVIV